MNKGELGISCSLVMKKIRLPFVKKKGFYSHDFRFYSTMSMLYSNAHMKLEIYEIMHMVVPHPQIAFSQRMFPRG